MIEILKVIGILIVVPVARSVSGWLTHALDDGVITEFEWRQLGVTVIRVGTMAGLGYLGLSSIGVDNAAVISSVASFFVDKLVDALKNN